MVLLVMVITSKAILITIIRIMITMLTIRAIIVIKRIMVIMVIPLPLLSTLVLNRRKPKRYENNYEFK